MSDRAVSNRSSWTGHVVTVVVALAVLLWFVQARRAPMQLLERRDCQNAYAAAKTPADSTLVDARQPLGEDRADRAAITCGKLRKMGRL